VNKCEWKQELVYGSPEQYVKTALIFHPCDNFDGSIDHYNSDGEYVPEHLCAVCKTDIRKPEPAKPLVVRSGRTWVAHWKGVNYLYCAECSSWKIEMAETSFSNFTRGHFIIDGWKPFSEITLDDEIAKLRPLCRFISSDPWNPGQLTWINTLVYVDENDYMTRNGTSHTECELLTAKELQEEEC